MRESLSARAALDALDALDAAFPAGGPSGPSGALVGAFSSYLVAPGDDAAAVRALMDEDGLPEPEAAAAVARHGHLFKQVVAALDAESARTGLTVEQLLQAHILRHHRAAALAQAKAAFVAEATALAARYHPGGRVPLEDVIRCIPAVELEALGAAHGLTLNADGEVTGLDGETEAALETTPQKGRADR